MLTEAAFEIPFNMAIFLPAGTVDWTVAANWSTNPDPYPDGVGITALVPASDTERNINFFAPVTIGSIEFPQAASAVRTRIRDRNTGNILTFDGGDAPARVAVGGSGVGFVEFENVAGLVLQSDLELDVTNLAGNAEFGGLRLRGIITGSGGVTKLGPGAAAITGSSKNFSGPVRIREGALLITGPSVPLLSSVTSVEPGGQLRLTSAGAPRVYPFGGSITLEGAGRDPALSEGVGVGGNLGALRFQPGSNNNRALIPTPINLAGDTTLYVDGVSNRIELAGPLSGSGELRFAGAGALTLGANSPAFTGKLQVDAGVVDLAAAYGAAGPATIAPGAVLRGHGRLGALSGGGVLVLDRTILRTAALGGLAQSFVFGRAGSPEFTTPAASGNALIAPAAAPVAPLSVSLYLDVADPSGSRFRGAYFLPASASWASVLTAPSLAVYRPDAVGLHSFDARSWTRIPNAVVTSVPHVADFGAGPVAGRILEVRVDADVALKFEDWRALFFPEPAEFADPAVSGPAAAPFGDGLPNLLRYALGVVDPADAAQLHPYLKIGDDDVRLFRFPFDPALSDVTYLVEATYDVADWSAPEILFDSTATALVPDVDGWLDVVDPTPPAPRRFYRLRIIQTP